MIVRRKDRSSAGRTLRGWAAAGLLAATASAGGCASLGSKEGWSVSKALDFDLRRGIPWTTAYEQEQKQPAKLIAIWTDAVLHTEGQPSTRGFGGRLMFYPAKGGDAVKVDGDVTVYAFVDKGAGSPEERAERKYVFTSEQLAKLYSKTNLGHSYSVWLPWGPVEGEAVHLSLIARYQPKEGPAVVSEQSMNLLPGREDPHRKAREMAASRAAAPPRVSAASVATPPGFSNLPAAPAPAGAPQQVLQTPPAVHPYSNQPLAAVPPVAVPQAAVPQAAAEGWGAAPLEEVRPVSLQTLAAEPPAVGAATRMQTTTFTMARGLPPGPAPQASYGNVPPGYGARPTANNYVPQPGYPPAGPQPTQSYPPYGASPQNYPPPNAAGLPGTGSYVAAGPQPELAWSAAPAPAPVAGGWNSGPQEALPAAGWNRASGGPEPPNAAANAWRRERNVGAPIPNVSRFKPIWNNQQASGQ